MGTRNTALLVTTGIALSGMVLATAVRTGATASRFAGVRTPAPAAAVIAITTVRADVAPDGPPPWPARRCVVDRGPVHFATVRGAMRYLAKAYNCSDLRALKRVTNPNSRAQLQSMLAEAKNLRFDSCTSQNWGTDYFTFNCHFTHDYPEGVAHDNPGPDGNGQADFTVYPADRPGWYATVVGCG